MKILHVINSFNRGGAETVVYSLSQELKSRGHLVDVFTFNVGTDDSQKLSGFDCHFSPKSIRQFGKGILPSLFYLNEKINFRQYDVVIFHLSLGALSLFFLRLLRTKNVRCRFIYVNHGPGVRQKLRNHLLNTFALIASDKFILIADSKKWLVLKQIFKSKIVTIHNGVIIPSQVPSKPILGLGPDQSIRLGTISRIARERYPERYLDFFVAMQNSKLCGIKFKSIFGGFGPEFRNISAQIKKLGLENEISLVGFVDDTLSFYANIDLFVTLCIGGFPGVAALEAISMGVPVVGFKVTAEVDPFNAIVRSFKDMDQLIEYSIALLSSPDALNREVNRQMGELKRNYSVVLMCDEYLKLLI